MIYQFAPGIPVSWNHSQAYLVGYCFSLRGCEWFIIISGKVTLFIEKDTGLAVKGDVILEALDNDVFTANILEDEPEYKAMAEFCVACFVLGRDECFKELCLREIIPRYVPREFRLKRYFTNGCATFIGESRCTLLEAFDPWKDLYQEWRVESPIVKVLDNTRTEDTQKEAEDLVFYGETPAYQRRQFAKRWKDAFRRFADVRKIISDGASDDVVDDEVTKYNCQTLDEIGIASEQYDYILS